MNKIKITLGITIIFISLLSGNGIPDDYSKPNEIRKKQEKLIKIERNIEENKRQLLAIFKEEIELIKKGNTPVDRKYSEYLGHLCRLIIKEFPYLNENILKNMLLIQNPYFQFNPSLIKPEEKAIKYLISWWKNESDIKIRKAALKQLCLISSPPVHSEDIDIAIYNRFHYYLTQKEKETLKSIFLNNLDNPDAEIRLLSVVGLRGFKKEADVILKLKERLKIENDDYIKERIRFILNK